MSVATTMPIKPGVDAKGRKLTPGSHQDVIAAIAAAMPGDTIVCPNITLPGGYRFLDKNNVTLELQPSTVIGGQSEGVYVYRCNSIRITGKGKIKAAGNGIGIYSGNGHLIDGQLTIAECGAMGVLINTSDGTPMDRIWIEGADISRCGDSNHSPDSSDPNYWKYGLHGIYFGGGRGGYVSGVIVANHIHDQPNGYGIQIGGQGQNVVIVSNLLERCDGASAGGPVSDRNARGIQVFSSYSNSKDVLIASNVMRDCPGAAYGSGPTGGTSQGVAHHNVFWRSGDPAYKYGSSTGLTDGGSNLKADYASVAAADAAGKLDKTFVWAGATTPPVEPPIPPVVTPVTISQTIKAGQTLSGIVTWTADTSDHDKTKSVDFLVDGVLLHTESSAPYGNGEPPETDAGQFDTTKHNLDDGTHTFSVKAKLTDGSMINNSATVTVKNSTTPPPVDPEDPWAAQEAINKVTDPLTKDALQKTLDYAKATT